MSWIVIKNRFQNKAFQFILVFSIELSNLNLCCITLLDVKRASDILNVKLWYKQNKAFVNTRLNINLLFIDFLMFIFSLFNLHSYTVMLWIFFMYFNCASLYYILFFLSLIIVVQITGIQWKNKILWQTLR